MATLTLIVAAALTFGVLVLMPALLIVLAGLLPVPPRTVFAVRGLIVLAAVVLLAHLCGC